MSNRELGLETVDGEKIGRNPRDMETAELEALGHHKMPLIKVIREKCLDCCCGSQSEVRKCTAVFCALWPFRMTKNVFSERTGNPAAIEALARAREQRK
jgi:hypothetical protein